MTSKPARSRAICDFSILRTLGEGAFSKVYLAVNKDTGAKVALKTLKKDAPLACHSEPSTLSRCAHKNIVRCMGSFDFNGSQCFVLEHFGMMDCFDYISKFGAFDDQKTKNIFGQLLDAVEFCHRRGIYHRDLKTENMLLDDQLKMKLCDFGLATCRFYCTDFGIGSPSYMAPELIAGVDGGYFSAAADVWSLGAILFKLRFEKVPWREAWYDDEDFLLFLSQPEKFKKLHRLSKEFMTLLRAVFDPNPLTRCSLAKLRLLVDKVVHFEADCSKEGNRVNISFCGQSAAKSTEKLCYVE